jgi:hypothetical protein
MSTVSDKTSAETTMITESEKLLNSELVRNVKPYSGDEEALYNFGRKIFSNFEGKPTVAVETRAERTSDGNYIKVTEHLTFPKPFGQIYLTRLIDNAISPGRGTYTTFISTTAQVDMQETGYQSLDIQGDRQLELYRLRRLLEIETGVLLII